MTDTWKQNLKKNDNEMKPIRMSSHNKSLLTSHNYVVCTHTHIQFCAQGDINIFWPMAVHIQCTAPGKSWATLTRLSYCCV